MAAITVHSDQLNNPALFDFIDLKGFPCRGADQEWFRDDWQRRAGCGPTTAATCLAYLAWQHPALAALSPGASRDAASFVPYMEAVWAQVTPTSRGLHALELYWQGSLAFGALHGCALTYDALEIGGKELVSRPSLSTCSAFLHTALEADLPLAFLNYSNGALTNLDSWHWVPLIAATACGDGSLPCLILDEGQEKTIDFSLWLRTTSQGGGLVALKPA